MLLNVDIAPIRELQIYPKRGQLLPVHMKEWSSWKVYMHIQNVDFYHFSDPNIAWGILLGLNPFKLVMNLCPVNIYLCFYSIWRNQEQKSLAIYLSNDHFVHGKHVVMVLSL